MIKKKRSFIMSIKSSDLDAIFNGAGAVVNSTANVCNAVAQGINDVQSCLDMSRRNQQYNQSGYGYGYSQPVTYGYGYGDTSGYPSIGYNGFQSQNNQAGYVGFTDPSYGSFSNNTNPNGFYGNGQNNRGGYWG